VQGASSIHLGSSGDLIIERDGVTLLQRRPAAYQPRNGQQVEIECEYRVTAANEVSLLLGRFDPSLPLVIDPVVEYASYLGGSGNDNATAIAIGADGYLYVAGATSSSNFPVLGAYDSTLGGTTDVFVAKINPATGKKVYATYIGGTGWDNANAIAVDSSGNVYVTGHAEARYPTTTGAYETSTITQAGFVTKVAAAGNALVYSTYVYGTTPRAIHVDSQGRAVITGAAGTSFVTSAGAFRTAYIGSTITDPTIGGDAFALMLNAAGTGTVFATFLGGTSTDEGRGVAIDSSGRIVVGGWTTSTDVPMVGAIQASFAGISDGFIAALAADGKSLVYSTYFGGTGNDKITGLAMDPYGNLVVSGDTASDDLPTANALLPRSSLALRNTTQKTFVAKFATAPLSLSFSTYAGSSDNCCESSYGIAADAAGDIYLLGYMNAGNLSHLQPVHPFMAASYVSTKLGTTNSDAFFAAGYSRDGQALRFQTLLGACGEAMQCGSGGIAAVGTSEIAVAGETHVTWMPIAAYNTQPKASVPSPTTADDEAFVLTLGMESPSLVVAAANANPVASTSVMLVATSYGAGTSGVVMFSDGATSLGTASMVQGVAKLNTTFAAGVHKITATLGSTQAPMLLLPVVLSGAQ
jgi:hypothetical protein